MPQDRAPTSDRLRSDIDSGRTADKVDFPDPAASPLGTDDEAAGNAPSAARRDIAAREETAPRERPAPERSSSIGPAILVAVVAVAVAAALIWILAR